MYLVSFAWLSCRLFENSLKIPYSDSIHCLRFFTGVKSKKNEFIWEMCRKQSRNTKVTALRLLLLCAEFITFFVSIISIQWFDLIVSSSCSSHAPHIHTHTHQMVDDVSFVEQFQRKNILQQEARHVKVRYLYISMRVTLSFFVVSYSIQCTFYLMNWNFICELCLMFAPSNR